MRPVPGRPPPPPPTVASIEPTTPKVISVDRVEEPLKLEDEPVEDAEAVAVEASPEEPLKLEEESAEDAVKEEPLKLEEEPEGPDEPEKTPEDGEFEEVQQPPKQEPKGRMSWMLSRSYPPPPPHARTRPGKPAMEPITFPLGDHLVSEVEGGLSCRKCGRTTPLSEADKFAGTPCGSTQNTQATPEPPAQCDICRTGLGVHPTPILDPLTRALNRKTLCESCFKDYLRMLRYAGPQVVRAKARAPPNGAWFSYGENNSVLFQQIGGIWPCPSCQEFYENLYDLAAHFVQKHPDIANRANEKIIINVDGKPVEALKTPQGYMVCPCGYLAENERHFSYHYSRDHGKA